jgi:hypothetical protein
VVSASKTAAQGAVGADRGDLIEVSARFSHAAGRADGVREASVSG